MLSSSQSSLSLENKLKHLEVHLIYRKRGPPPLFRNIRLKHFCAFFFRLKQKSDLSAPVKLWGDLDNKNSPKTVGKR